MSYRNLTAMPLDNLGLPNQRTCCRCGAEFYGTPHQRVCSKCKAPPLCRKDPRRSPELSAREKQVAALVALSLPNKEIAARLHLSEGTIKVYLFHIFRKLKVENRTDLAVWEVRRAMQELLAEQRALPELPKAA